MKFIKHTTRKKILTIIIFFLVVFLFIPTVKAGVWGESIYASILQTMVEEIQKSIRDAIINSLKEIAIETTDQLVMKAVNGVNGATKAMVSDWQDFLNDTPVGVGDLYLNDFFEFSFSGAGSLLNYNSDCDFAETIQDQAKKVTVNVEFPQFTINNYVCNSIDLATDVFADGTWNAFSSLAFNPMNNPFGAALVSETIYDQKIQEEKNKQQIKATSSGFLSVEDENGNVTTPAGVVEALAGKAKTMGMDALAQADNIPAIITSLVTRIATTAITQGINEVKDSVQDEINEEIQDY